MVANFSPQTLGVRSKGQNSTFSEHGHVAYQLMTDPNMTEKLLTEVENQNIQLNCALDTKKGEFMFNVFISK